MIPTLWRYALKSYVRVFLLSVCTFIAVLLISRFKEIARFAALTADWGKTGLFLVYQIPLILPMAIPISAAIASLLLFQRLSRTCELTALRASGYPLRSILAPLLLASLVFSIFNFSLCAEIAPFCRREAKTLTFRETSANPLLLLQRQKLVKMKDAYINMEVFDEGLSAKDLILILYNDTNQHLTLLSAKKLHLKGDELLGSDVAIVSHLPGEKTFFFDPLIIENQELMSTAAPLLSAALKKNRPRLETNSLSLKMLNLRKTESAKLARSAQNEILRRVSLSVAVFSLTLLGCAFGIDQGRNPSKKGLYAAFFLTLSVLISYLLGKELKKSLPLASLAYFTPHLIIWVSSYIRLRRLKKGTL